MSEQEQHELLGRTITQKSEATRSLALLTAKAKGYADQLEAMVRHLRTPSTIPVDAIQRFVTREQLMEVFAEIRDAQSRIIDLTVLLDKMGYEVFSARVH